MAREGRPGRAVPGCPSVAARLPVGSASSFPFLLPGAGPWGCFGLNLRPESPGWAARRGEPRSARAGLGVMPGVGRLRRGRVRSASRESQARVFG